jgi:hypothetical protein
MNSPVTVLLQLPERGRKVRRMKKVTVTLAIVVVALIAVGAFYPTNSGVNIITTTITSDGSGDAYINLSNVNGYIEQVTTWPSSGATSPTANWDLVGVDDNNVDLFLGNCANRSQSTTESEIMATPAISGGTLRLEASNMGATNVAYAEIKVVQR